MTVYFPTVDRVRYHLEHPDYPGLTLCGIAPEWPAVERLTRGGMLEMCKWCGTHVRNGTAAKPDAGALHDLASRR